MILGFIEFKKKIKGKLNVLEVLTFSVILMIKNLFKQYSETLDLFKIPIIS